IEVTGAAADAAILRRKVAQTIKNVTDDYEGLRFNTAVAYLMELANAMQDYLQGGGQRDASWDDAVRTLVKLLNPVGPHISEEMWERLGEKTLLADASWPEYDAAAAAEPEITIVVQVNGRVRDRLMLPAGTGEDKVRELALASEKVRSALDGGTPAKVVYVPDRLINFVV